MTISKEATEYVERQLKACPSIGCRDCLHDAYTAGRERGQEEIDLLRNEIELERMRIAACGVAAMENTEETVAHRIFRDNPYWSASYGDICAAVDREMKLREERDELKYLQDKAIALVIPGVCDTPEAYRKLLRDAECNRDILHRKWVTVSQECIELENELTRVREQMKDILEAARAVEKIYWDYDKTMKPEILALRECLTRVDEMEKRG